MFKKILIANRGEIAVRIIQTCREMGIATVALYQESDESSLHVRLSDECVLLKTPNGFMDQAEILRIAAEKGADAIHPGYGFLAENLEFIRACEAAGIVFIGPPSTVVEQLSNKLAAVERVRSAGLPTVETSSRAYRADEVDALRGEAERVGYPLVVKSSGGGRGPGERLARTPEQVDAALLAARSEAQLVYGVGQVYLEKAILPAHQIGVQVIADQHGNLVHVEEREGSVLHNGQKVVEESPAPCLTPAQRAELCRAALDIARLFHYENVGTVEFLVGENGQFTFTEVKPRLQVEHPLTEMRARIDLVREQIRIAAGEPISFTQERLNLQGWAMLCRVNAEDLLTGLPSSGTIHVRLPLGAEVRVDTYIADQGFVPTEYNPLVAKLTTWGSSREVCLERMRHALQDLWLPGGSTNLPLLLQVLDAEAFRVGAYSTDFHALLSDCDDRSPEYNRALAVASAVLYVKRHRAVETVLPDRVISGWHRDSRRLPD